MTLSQYNIAHAIMREAEEQIRRSTGISIRMEMQELTSPVFTEEALLAHIADAMQMNIEDYKRSSKETKYVELRFVAALMLRRFFPNIPLSQIGGYFNRDHTTVINALTRGQELLDGADISFLRKYNIVLASVEQWNNQLK